MYAIEINLVLLQIRLLIFLEREREREGEREREMERDTKGDMDFIVLLMYAFIGCFLYMLSPKIEPTTLAYWEDALTN